MLVNRFNTPVRDQYMSQYVPIPFEQLYAIGKEYANERKAAEKQLADHIKKVGEFQSLIGKDVDSYYDIAMTDTINQMADAASKNPSLMKDAAWRSQLNSAINSVDYAALSKLKKSAEQADEYDKLYKQLAAKGDLPPGWEPDYFTNYSTLENGIFNETPLQYQSVNELVMPYVDKIPDTFLGSRGGYNWTGVSEDTLVEQVDKNKSEILNTPIAQRHMQLMMNAGMSPEEAQDAFLTEAYTVAKRNAHKKPTADPYAMLQMQQKMRKSGKEQEPPILRRSTKMIQDELLKGRNILQYSGLADDSKMDDVFSRDLFNKTQNGKNQSEQISAGRTLTVWSAMRKALNPEMIRLGITDNTNPIKALVDNIKKDGKGTFTEEDGKVIPNTKSGYSKLVSQLYIDTVNNMMTNTGSYSAMDTERLGGKEGYVGNYELMSPKQFVLQNNDIREMLEKQGLSTGSVKMKSSLWGSSEIPIDVDEEIAKHPAHTKLVSVTGETINFKSDGTAETVWNAIVKYPIDELPDAPGSSWHLMSSELDTRLREMGYDVVEEEDGKKYVYGTTLIVEPLNEQTRNALDMQSESIYGTNKSEDSARWEADQNVPFQ